MKAHTTFRYTALCMAAAFCLAFVSTAFIFPDAADDDAVASVAPNTETAPTFNMRAQPVDPMQFARYAYDRVFANNPAMTSGLALDCPADATTLYIWSPDTSGDVTSHEAVGACTNVLVSLSTGGGGNAVGYLIEVTSSGQSIMRDYEMAGPYSCSPPGCPTVSAVMASTSKIKLAGSKDASQEYLIMAADTY